MTINDEDNDLFLLAHYLDVFNILRMSFFMVSKTLTKMKELQVDDNGEKLNVSRGRSESSEY